MKTSKKQPVRDLHPSYVGTAGWSVPKEFSSAFPTEGTHLQRYAQVLNAVEINSSFYRHHQPSTYSKWADSTPSSFRFAVKLSKVFTHVQKLEIDPDELAEVLSGISNLKEKWGALLIQLPPKLAFEAKTATTFFRHIRRNFNGLVAFEPRHVSWALPESQKNLNTFSLTKVNADPEPCPLPESENKVRDLYFRWHGSPQIYKSKYDLQRLTELSAVMRAAHNAGKQTWCIFDNTTFGHATDNALCTKSLLSDRLHQCVNSEKTSPGAEPAAMAPAGLSL